MLIQYQCTDLHNVNNVLLERMSLFNIHGIVQLMLSILNGSFRIFRAVLIILDIQDLIVMSPNKVKHLLFEEQLRT